MAKDEQRQKPGARTIDWSSAEISDGILAVEIREAAPKGWSKDFAGVLALLEQSGQGWGRVSLKGSTVRVADVQAGVEEGLRHFLESVVHQVNSDLGLRTAERSCEQSDGERSASERQEAAERKMVATFRSFAGGAD
jgi:hypothetical protein